MAKYGCPLVTDEEITIAAEALSKASNYAVQGQGARNLAYAALTAVRGAHFQETAEQKKPEPSQRTDWHYDSQGYCDNPGRGY